jgi:hypothetical protein
MENSMNKVTRRDILKKGLKTAGYVVPAMAFLSMGSLDSWAKSYHRPVPIKPIPVKKRPIPKQKPVRP